MANITYRFYSNCLNRPTTVKIYLPYDERQMPPEMMAERPEKTKTLFLLHGYTGDGENWVPEWLCDKYNVAVVCPSGENGFWLDGLSSGHAYAKFLGEELPRYMQKTFNLAKDKDETFVMGLSMGGFGALHTALKYPEVFGKAAALSSALIHNEVAKMKEGEGNEVANYEYYRECFGEPSKLAESENNPEFLVKKLKAEGKEFPQIIMACGTEDFLIENNRKFHQFLVDNGVPHTYDESTGIHDMVFWSKCVEKYIPVMFGKEE